MVSTALTFNKIPQILEARKLHRCPLRSPPQKFVSEKACSPVGPFTWMVRGVAEGKTCTGEMVCLELKDDGRDESFFSVKVGFACFEKSNFSQSQISRFLNEKKIHPLRENSLVTTTPRPHNPAATIDIHPAIVPALRQSRDTPEAQLFSIIFILPAIHWPNLSNYTNEERKTIAKTRQQGTRRNLSAFLDRHSLKTCTARPPSHNLQHGDSLPANPVHCPLRISNPNLHPLLLRLKQHRLPRDH